MEITRAEYLLPERMRAGDTVRTTQGALYDKLKREQQSAVDNDPAGAGLSLSQVGRTISFLTKDRDANSATAASGFSEFMNSVHQQILADGKDAPVFRETPSGGADRLALAKQASNCLSMCYYGGEKVHPDVSARNPFASLDRLSLSHIAFDDTGRFTSVERQLASLEMSERDTSFRSSVYDLASSLGGNDAVPWHDIVSHLADSRISSAMCDAERSWLGWGTSESLTSFAAGLMSRYAVDAPCLPGYPNLKGHGEAILGFSPPGAGDAGWTCMPLKPFHAAARHWGRWIPVVFIREPLS